MNVFLYSLCSTYDEFCLSKENVAMSECCSENIKIMLICYGVSIDTEFRYAYEYSVIGGRRCYIFELPAKDG